jgi:hypothetical protein
MNATRRRATSRVSRLARAAAVSVKGLQRQPGAHVPQVAPPIETPSRRTVHHEAPGTRVTRQVESAHPAAILPAAIADDLLKGHLSQHCPDCGITEAAGGYCTKCDRRTGPADWFRQTRGRPVSGPQNTPEKALKGGPGRPRGHVDTGALVTQPTADPDAGFWPA